MPDIKSIDVSAALAMPGVIAVVTGEDLEAAGVGGLPCGWGITGKDGLPMKEPPHPALAQGKVRHVGDPVALRRGRNHARRRVRPPPRRSSSNTKCCRPWSACSKPSSATRRCCSTTYPNNLCCDWALGDNAATEAAFRKAAHVAAHQPRQQSPGRQPDGAARGDRRIQRCDRPVHAVVDQPVSARRAPADGRLRAQHSAAQAARGRARCRRRFRRQAVPLCRRSGHHLGRAAKSAGQ